jgi:hypothetical protein
MQASLPLACTAPKVENDGNTQKTSESFFKGLERVRQPHPNRYEWILLTSVYNFQKKLAQTV